MKIIESLIPIFLLAVAIELYFCYKKNKDYYNLADSLSNMSLGILSRLTDLFVLVGMYHLYHWIQANFALDLWSDSHSLYGKIGWWVFLFIALDFLFYWHHRLSHEINLLWASHVTHHSSEEFNLTVALRQSFLRNFIALIFYSTFAFIGVPWIVLLIVDAMNRLYQFWVHTRFQWKFPKWFEFLFVVPSHHRVHHARNPEYIDKNYAGMFILWDRIFGTFEEEKNEPVYGIVHPLESYNPIRANLHLFWELVLVIISKLSWKEKWKLLFSPPGYTPPSEEIQKLPKDSILRKKWELHLTPEQSIQILIHRVYLSKKKGFLYTIIFTLLIGFSLLLIKSNLSLDLQFLGFIVIIIGFWLWGYSLDREAQSVAS